MWRQLYRVRVCMRETWGGRVARASWTSTVDGAPSRRPRHGAAVRERNTCELKSLRPAPSVSAGLVFFGFKDNKDSYKKGSNTHASRRTLA